MLTDTAKISLNALQNTLILANFKISCMQFQYFIYPQLLTIKSIVCEQESVQSFLCAEHGVLILQTSWLETPCCISGIFKPLPTLLCSLYLQQLWLPKFVPAPQHSVFAHWLPIRSSIATIHHAYSYQTLQSVIYGYMLLSMDTKPFFCLLTPKFNLLLCFKIVPKYCRELGL